MALSVSLPEPTDEAIVGAQAPNLVTDVQAALRAYEEDPGSVQTQRELAARSQALADAVAALQKRDTNHPLVKDALLVARKLWASGFHDYPLGTETRTWAATHPLTQWPNLVAATLLGSAWQWPDLPEIETTPQWLWGDFATWVFAAPQGFVQVGDADRYANFLLPRLEQLARLVERAGGSASVRAAADGYLAAASVIPLYFSQGNLRKHAEIRGRILKRLIGREALTFSPMPFPREGRRLRIGFLNRHFGSQTETYTTLPTFEHLDADRFEVILFSLRPADTPLAEYCRSRVQEFRVLPSDFDQQLATLRDANLDVLVFGTNVTAVVHEVTRLALYRIAPLQIVNNSSCITTGFPEIDLYISGDLTECANAAEHFTERLALLPGPAHAFNYEADKEEPTVNWTREMLSIPQDAIVFATAANYYKIVPEMQQAWAKLLARVPNSRLLVHPFNPNWSSQYPIKRFCAEFDRVMLEHGVSADRLMISTERFPSRSDVRALLSVADVYVDTFPFGGVNSIIDPLEAGIPVVVWEGDTFRSRMGSAILRVLKTDELIATSEQAYLDTCIRLGTDAAYRAQLKERITTAMGNSPLFLDRLAASDSFAGLITAAFDEILAVGPQKFKAERLPFRVPVESDVAAALSSSAYLIEVGLAGEAEEQLRRLLSTNPADTELRHMMGKVLLSVNRDARAAEYLLAAVQNGVPSSELWRQLATAFERSGNAQDALTALETAIKLEPRNPEGWFQLGSIARRLGHTEMLADIVKMLEELVPGDTRLGELRPMAPGAV